MIHYRELARTLVALADTLVADFDVVEMLTTLTDRSVELLGVDAAGLMLLTPGGELRVVASSSDAMRLLELFELQASEGPCLDAYRTGQPVIDVDLTAEHPRWPTFAAEAVRAGFVVAHAVPMRLRGEVIGALNLFDRRPHTLDEEDLAAVTALADVATIALLQYRAVAEANVLNDQLNRALTTRVVIEQAKGMLAERLKVDLDEAFAVLRRYARDHNLRLADLAQGVVAGTADTAAFRRR